MNFLEQLSVEQVESVPLPKVVEIESPKDNMNNALPKNDASLLNEETNMDLRSLALTKASDTSSINLSQNNNIAEIVKETMRVANVNPASSIITLSNEKPTISEKVNETDKNSDKSNEINMPNKKNQETIEQNEVITITEKTALIDNNVMKEIVSSSQNYKQFVNKIFLSIGKLYKSGIFSNNTDKLNKICDLFDNIIISYINENSSAQKNHEETSSDNNTNEKGKNAEIELHLQTMKQEREENDDDNAKVVSKVVTRVEIDTVPEEQSKSSQIETVQNNKQQPQQKNNNKYNYYDQYNGYVTSNENSNSLIKETRPPCPPSAVPNLQQNQSYNNQNFYTNQKSTYQNFRYPHKRSYNRQTPYPRCPQQMNQVPIQPPSQNQQAYTQYPQYINQQSFQMQNQMQGMFSQNTPYH
ncbi:unnamed protein product [Euphydryas editha]|uniref:Uncharacterized protein n=1 Tax=Euphydryas editha TaxID=104508 RepID=A0AAU9UGL8_EUPED|nr:unnamed protein product [Euphydryas editha]